MILNEFDIKYVEIKSIKGQFIKDQLVDAPMFDNYPLASYFPDQAIFVITPTQPWKLYFNGYFTLYRSGVSILLITAQGDFITKSFILAFMCINNIAKDEAPITGLRMAIL